MSDSKQEPNNNLIPDEDEMSMVDLLVVLLRRRRLILGLTLAAAVLSALLVFFLPPRQYQSNLDNEMLWKTEKYEAVAVCSLSSSVLSFNAKQQVNEFVLLSLNDPEIILKSLKANGIEASSEDGKSFFNASLEKNGLFRISVIREDREQAERLISTLLEEANLRLAGLLMPAVKAEIRSFEQLTELKYSDEIIENDIVSAFYRYSAAQHFAAGEESALMVVQEYQRKLPAGKMESIRSLRNKLITKAIISVAAVFLFSIFFAFILQAIENVKNDPVSIKKLKKALGK